MPRKPVDYSKGVVYKICCKDPVIADVYVGSTTDLYRRKYNHKSNCTNQKKIQYNTPVYKFIREHGGFDNWSVVEIEKYPCKDKQELLTRERYWLEELGATLNKQIPTRNSVERRKKYYGDNRGVILEHMKKYYNVNREKIRKKRNQKIACLCGLTFPKSNKSKHEKSAHHLTYLLEQKNNGDDPPPYTFAEEPEVFVYMI